MLYNIYDIFHSKYSHQHVSAGIPAIFRVTFSLQEYKRTNLVNSDGHTVNQTCNLLIIVSPRRWPECRPKHVGEKIANEIYHKYFRAFVGYLYTFGSD